MKYKIASYKYYIKILVNAFEVITAALVIFGVLASIAANMYLFAGADWTLNDTFYDFIYRVLLIVIGLELVRMLVVHDLSAVLELIAFVIARKLLTPDLTVWEILLAVLAFMLLLYGRKYLLTYEEEGDDPPTITPQNP